MADLASSLSAFLFPEGFQPLDGCDEVLDAEAFMKSTQNCNMGTEEDSNYEYSQGLSFQEPLDMNTPLEVCLEMAVKMEPEDLEDTPSTPNKPPVHLPCLSPLTPTANLKVLISAASPEIRVLASKRQKKALFNAIADHASSLQEGQVIDVGMESLQEEVVEIECMSQGEDGVEDGDKPINRKSKSLGLLCQRFLSRYPDFPENGVAMAISLDAVSKDLGVERRRIYDIVNVLESIEMVSRVAKNKYLWHGKMNIECTLARLKCLGEKKRYADQIVHLKKLQIENEYSDELEQLSKQPFRDIGNIGTNSQDMDDKKEMDRFDEYINSRRDKSLGVMSQKFIMLFLVSQAKVITLDIAARVLIGDINYEIREGSKFKTKVRRLYDIANILTSLDMIQKVHVQEGRGRKPAFRWIGPSPDTSRVDPSDVYIENAAPSRQSFFSAPAAPLPTPVPQDTKPSPASHPKGTKKVAWSRHASFNAICEVVERERRSYSSAPNSPTKDGQGDKPPETPIDEKFRQDFEALRFKYPDQMSQIYVTEKQASAGQEDNATPNRACPNISVPISSPKCTPGSTAGFAPLNPKVIVSPIPGSLPVGNNQCVSSAVSLPLSFSLIKSDGSVTSRQGAIPDHSTASVPSSSEATSILDAPSATSPSQYSLLTSTGNALHMVLRHLDSARCSKRTIKQPISGEYQPVVKRSKMEHEAASALQRGCQDFTEQIQPQQTRYLKIPVEGKLLQQPTGNPVQTIIIRRDVSVLNKNTNPLSDSVAWRDLEARTGGGHHQGTITTTLVPSSLLTSKQPGLTARQQTTPNKQVNQEHLTSCSSPPYVPQNTTYILPAKGSPELTCMESLHDIDDITSTAQLPFHDVIKEQTFHCMGQEEKSILQPTGTADTKQQLGQKGLRLDKSKDMHRKTGIQRNPKETNIGNKNRRPPRQREHHPCLRQKPVRICKRPTVARALHLCPEFRNAKVAMPTSKDSTDSAVKLACSLPANYQAEDRFNGPNNGNRIRKNRDYSVELNYDTDETLAWPLHYPSYEPTQEGDTAKRVPSQTKPATESESWLRLSHNCTSQSSLSLPCSPLASFNQSGRSDLSPISICSRPRSVSSLGVSDTQRSSVGSLRGSKPAVSPVVSCGFGDTWRFPKRDSLVMPYVTCLSPAQRMQLVSPLQKSNHCRGQAGHVQQLGPRCISSALYNLPKSPLPFVYYNGSMQPPDVHSSGSTSESRACPTVTIFPPVSSSRPERLQTPISSLGQYPHTGGLSCPSPMTKVQISPFVGSLFRPISSSGNIRLSFLPDQNPSSPVLSQSQDPKALNPVVPASLSESRVSPSVGYPNSQSTPVTGHQLLPPLPVTPVVQRTSIASQSRHPDHCSGYMNRSPRLFASFPTHVSGNGLVYISSSDILNNLDNN